MTDQIKKCTYELFGYRVADQYCDGLLSRGEVQIEIEDQPDKYRELTPGEWKKFAESKAVRYLFGFTPIEKNNLDGETIIRALETNPAVIPDIIEEMDGVGYVILTLEGYLFDIPADKTAKAKEELRKWKSDFVEYFNSVSEAPTHIKEQIVGAVIEISKQRTNDMGEEAKTADTLLQNGENNFRNPKILEALSKFITIPGFIMTMKGVTYKENGMLTDAILDKKTDCDRYAALYTHLAQKVGLNLKLYIFNDHVTVIFEDKDLPGGRIIFEVTDGYIIDIETYKNSDAIACLDVGLPASAFERNTETIINSPIMQYVNDMSDSIGGKTQPPIAKSTTRNQRFVDELNLDELHSELPQVDMLLQMARGIAPLIQYKDESETSITEKEKRYNEAIKYLKILERIRPNDLSLYMLGQIICLEAGKERERESWRKKIVDLIEQMRE